MNSKIKIFFFILLISQSLVFSQIDSAKELAKNKIGKKLTLIELVDLAKKNFKNNLDKAKFVYYWVGLNITYDYDLYNLRNSHNFDYERDYSYNLDSNKVFEMKKGVCLGYSTLYKSLMNELDIECEIISGYIRDEKNHYIELEKDSDFGHAWNAIKINNKWLLVDTTWGTSNDENISDFYFDINPIRAIITHYPKDEKWQLLEKSLSLEEFNNSKFIDPNWFLSGFTDNPKMKQDENYYYFVFKNNPIENFEIIINYSVDDKTFQKIKNQKSIKQDGYTYVRFEKKSLPKTLYFSIDLFQKNEIENWTSTVKSVINFKIN